MSPHETLNLYDLFLLSGVLVAVGGLLLMGLSFALTPKLQAPIIAIAGRVVLGNGQLLAFVLLADLFNEGAKGFSELQPPLWVALALTIPTAFALGVIEDEKKKARARK